MCCVASSGPDLRRSIGVVDLEDDVEDQADEEEVNEYEEGGDGDPPPHYEMNHRKPSAWVKQLLEHNGLDPPHFSVKMGGPRYQRHFTCYLRFSQETYRGRGVSSDDAKEAAANSALLRSRLPRPTLALSDYMMGLRVWSGVLPIWKTEEPKTKPLVVDSWDSDDENDGKKEKPMWNGPPCRNPSFFGLPRFKGLEKVVPVPLTAISAVFSKRFAPLPREEAEHTPVIDPRLDLNNPTVRGLYGYAGAPKYVPTLEDAVNFHRVTSVRDPEPDLVFPETGFIPPQMIGYSGYQLVLPSGLEDVLKNPTTGLEFLMRVRPDRCPPLSWRLYAWFWHGVCPEHTPEIQREAIRREARRRRMAASDWTPPRALRRRELVPYGGGSDDGSESNAARSRPSLPLEEKREKLVPLMELGAHELSPFGGGEKLVLVSEVSEATRMLARERWSAAKLAKARKRQARLAALVTNPRSRELIPYGGEALKPVELGKEWMRRQQEERQRARRARLLMSNARFYDDHRPSIPVGKRELTPFGGGDKVWPQPTFYPIKLLDQQIKWEEAAALRCSDNECRVSTHLERPDRHDLRYPPNLPVELEWKLRFRRPTDAVPLNTLFMRLQDVSVHHLQDLLPGLIARAEKRERREQRRAVKRGRLDPSDEELFGKVRVRSDGVIEAEDLRTAIRVEMRRRQLSSGSECSSVVGHQGEGGVAEMREVEEEEEEEEMEVQGRRKKVRRVKIGCPVEENGEELMLFRVGDSVFATSARCPHMGGPLGVGDIESLAEGDCVVRCPWHNFAFNLSQDGKIVFPAHRTDLRLKVYPVKTDEVGHIYIGFSGIKSKFFNEPVESISNRHVRQMIKYDD